MLFDGLPNKKSKDENNEAPLFDDLPEPSTVILKTSTNVPGNKQEKTEDIKEENHNKDNDVTKGKTDGTNFDFLPTTLRKRKKPSKVVAPQRRSLSSNRTVSNVEDNSVVNIHEETNQSVSLIPSSPIQDEYEEPQSLVDRHASIFPADMYVPSIPNDYLTYRQKRENESLQADLKEQEKKTLEMQNKLRLKIEEERQKAMNKAIESGNFDDVIQSRLGSNTGSSMGRGRGMNNLPAWLLKKQKESEKERMQSS